MLFLSGCQKIYKTTAAKAAHHFIQTVDKGNVFVFISNSGRFEPTLNLAKEARLHGMIVISISSIENNDLAEVSDYNLRFFSKPREYEGADFTSRLGSFFVISSFMEYFNLQRKGDNSNEPSASD
ncbi:MAG: SIS domain-containing protein [Agathobacter rectalis]|jgi:DNA-binding MurR/RpiR family transcriptional regulator